MKFTTSSLIELELEGYAVMYKPSVLHYDNTTNTVMCRHQPVVSVSHTISLIPWYLFIKKSPVVAMSVKITFLHGKYIVYSDGDGRFTTFYQLSLTSYFS